MFLVFLVILKNQPGVHSSPSGVSGSVSGNLTSGGSPGIGRSSSYSPSAGVSAAEVTLPGALLLAAGAAGAAAWAATAGVPSPVTTASATTVVNLALLILMAFSPRSRSRGGSG
ncbi:hypothetical protein B7C62_21065 [Kitasatospora albolonga]|uniref:Uncharacterized protein n=1 Tax=Kitasatospora albolonga TaxID=68173 RepID=A0ABC8BVI3_9ACTN|nr:hypothetical protein B7C62_21065 [Kitasatospora albolonga]